MKNKTPKDKTITLCMIVKDESHIIKECLTSMLPYIDRYDITDTGSTDGTPELIKEFMNEHEVEGEVYLSDWKGFGDHAGNIGSRTESLRNAKGKADYAWVIDADDFVTGDFKFPEEMTKDSYSLRIGREDFTWWRNQLFLLKSDWVYTGILHEFAECKGKPADQVTNERIMGEYRISARTLGARNVNITTQEKYSRDAEALEKAIKEEPDNVRYQFYLAQSYFDSQQYEKSEEAYKKRAEMGGWEEEVFYSLYRVGILAGLLNKPWPEIQQAFLDAYEYRPNRAEPLYQIARLYRQVHDRPKLAYMYARMALEIPYPQNDILFISEDVYKYQILDEVGATAYYAGKPHIGLAACQRLINENLVPQEHRQRCVDNLKQYTNLIEQIHAHEAQMKVNEEIAKKEKKMQDKIDKRNAPKKGTKSNQNKKGKKRQKVHR
jgi:glycosyltransferase involved in cell wall biosynthesis